MGNGEGLYPDTWLSSGVQSVIAMTKLIQLLAAVKKIVKKYFSYRRKGEMAAEYAKLM